MVSAWPRHRFGLALLLITTLAAALRLWVLVRAYFILDGDEAIIGLMARHLVTRGEFALFFYGQPYMAPTDAWLAAPFIALFVGSSWVKAGPLLWSVVLVGLNGWLARLFFTSERAGLLAALLTAFPPLYFLINTLRALGSFSITLALGGLLLLLAYRLVFTPLPPHRAALQWFLLGLITGFGFYASWLIAFYCGPVAFFLLLKEKWYLSRRTFAFGLAGFAVGSLPLWLYNFSNSFETLRYFTPKPGGMNVPPDKVFNFFFTQSLPLAIGVRQYWFPTSWRISLALTILWLVIWFGWLVARWRGWTGWFRLSLRDAQPVDMLLLFGLFAPILYWASGVGDNAFTLPNVDTTGRYLLPLMAVAPVLASGALNRLADWEFSRPLGGGLAALGLLALLLAQLWPYRHADFVATFQSPYYAQLRPPLNNRTVIDYLLSQHIEYTTCNHWIGNRLMLEAEERIKCVDYYDVLVGGGADRFPELTRAIRTPGRRVAFVLVNPLANATPLEAELRALGVTFTRRDFPPYTVIIPISRPVSPDEVVDTLGYPY
jgi:hypothetical protein